MKLMVINGPNLNLLGKREPDIYGRETYGDLCDMIFSYGKEKGFEVEIMQSNHEGDLVDAIGRAADGFDGIVINPAAYTHTSIAILDAVKAVGVPTVEVHISNVMEREAFRHHSFVAPIAKKTYMGLGFEGYRRAIRYLAIDEE